MIANKNDFIYALQQRVITKMQESLQWGSVTVPSYKGDLAGCFDEAKTILLWGQEAVAALEALKIETPPEE